MYNYLNPSEYNIHRDISMNICDFCDTLGIKYFGIRLNMEGGKKIPTYVDLYKTTPKQTDFAILSNEELEERRKHASLFEYIAIDTREYQHIDVDFKEGEEYNKESRKYVDDLCNLSAYFKSTTKKLGKHIFIKSNSLGTNKRPQTIFKDIEILNGQWSYAKTDVMVYNTDRLYEFEDEDVEEFIKGEEEKDAGYSSGTITPPLQTPQADSKLAQVLNLIPPEDYDIWTRCVWALKNDSETHYALAKEWSKRSNKYEEDAFDKLWENGRQGLTIATIYYYANRIAPEAYRQLYIKFDLSYNDDQLAETFIKLQSPNVIYSNEMVYIYNNNWVVEKPKNCLQLKKLIRKTLHEYILKVEIDFNRQMIGKDENELRVMEKTKELIKKVFDKVSTRSQIDNITQFVLQDLASDNLNVEFDLGEDQLYNLHFRNGCYELNNKRFRKRTQSDYITQYLDWDYDEKTPKELIEELRSFYSKIQPDPVQLKYMMEWLAYCLTGSVGKQKFKMNIGYSAQNGKSTEFKIHNAVFPIYSMKLDNQTFDKGYTKRHKQMIHLIQKPIRFAYCEELRSLKLDTDFVKEFVDGSDMNVEIMYDTSKTKTIQAKLNTCSNKDFNLDKDCGIQRRGTVQFYTSKFLKGVEDDPAKHIYCRIDEFEKRFLDAKYKNAYLHLLLEYYDINFNTPEVNENAFAEIMNEYDECGSFLSAHFEITNNENDRIGKCEMVDLFNAWAGNKKYDHSRLLREMKSAGVKYDRKRRCNNKQGCYVGIKKLDIDDEEECDDI